MQRRTFLTGAAWGLFAIVGGGLAGCGQIPVIPKRPEPNVETAIGWITHRDGRFTLKLPRAEMGQNIATALKQIACAELGTAWEAVRVEFYDTTLPRVKATVGSESIMLFAEPVAQACAAVREALADGQTEGEVLVRQRPLQALHAFQKGSMVGSSPPLEQGMEIVTGRALFAADVRLPEMLFGRVLRAPASVEIQSRPARWDSEAARAVPGFVAVTENCGPPIGKANGLGILVTRPSALDAVRAALNIEWDIGVLDGKPVLDASYMPTAPDSSALPHVVRDGTPQPGSWDVDLQMEIPISPHSQIEPRAAVADWRDKKLKIWSGTQDAFYVSDVLAKLFGLGTEDITVQSCRIGGGFGGRTICTVEAEAAALAKVAGRPVKVQWTRAQEYEFGFHRPPSSHRIRARVTNGRITDWDHGQTSSHILFTAAVLPAWLQKATDLFAGDGGVARGMAAPYNLGRARAAYDAIRIPLHTGPWRGLGAGPNGLAIESAMDEAAIAAGIDPLFFRLAHVEDPRLAAVLTRVAEISDWARRPAAPPGLRLGRGVACGIYKEKSYAAAVADVMVDPQGNVKVTGLWCVHDCGLVINPDQVRAQCEGNLVWGLSMILFDRLAIAQGRSIAESFTDAPIPRFSDVPPIRVELIAGDQPPTGAGETAIVAGPGAIANAIRAATGKRLTRLPVRPGDLSL